MADEPEVVLDRRGAVLVMRINRPDVRNALNTAVTAGIGAALIEAEQTPDVRALVLTGTGDRAFCSGMDLADFARGGTAARDDEREAVVRFRSFLTRGRCELPVVGAANGTALAGGFELLLACDLVVAADTARFGLPEVKRGLFAAGGGVFIGRRIPVARALELTLTGDPIDADDAWRLGLVNRVVPSDRVLDEALALAERIAENGPMAVRATKELVRLAALSTSDEVWAVHNERRQAVFASEDAKEGSLAFVEKRPPAWKGR